MTSPLNLYVSSNGVDHGPLTIEEATEKVGSGEFQPDDLSWHQGVSGWVPMKELPEWSKMNKPVLPPLAAPQKKAENEKELNDSSLVRTLNKTSRKEPKLNQGQTNSAKPLNQQVVQNTGMSLIGKLMVSIAILVFISTLGVVGFLIYKNLDKFIPPVVESPAQQKSTEPAANKQIEKKEELEVDLETNSIAEPDPFAPPQDN